MKNIYLIGFMGCGKSTIAGTLSKKLGVEQVEMDELIVEEQGMPITEIFEKYGEEHFRDIETDLVRRLQEKAGVVVSCGGGAVLRKENRSMMKQSGVIVLLTAKPKTILERVKNSTNRPVLNGNMNVEYISSLMERRRVCYEDAADIVVATDDKNVEEICKEIIEKNGTMKIECIWEHNGDDTLLYAKDWVGAFTRGENLAVALKKMKNEVQSYARWCGKEIPEEIEPVIVQEKKSELEIKDADSDVLFASEEAPLTMEEYVELRDLALKSAEDFLRLYESIPDKNASALPVRETFYGQIPRTAEEMYLHTKGVNSYYFAEIGIEADNEGTIYECRKRGFEQLEKQPDFLSGRLQEGSYGEMWSVRKVLRRFIWHDRIHGKAMYRMAKKTFENGEIE